MEHKLGFGTDWRLANPCTGAGQVRGVQCQPFPVDICSAPAREEALISRHWPFLEAPRGQSRAVPGPVLPPCPSRRSGAGQCQGQPSPASRDLARPGARALARHSQNPVVLYWDRMVAISPQAGEQDELRGSGIGRQRNPSPQPASSPQSDRHLWPRGRIVMGRPRLTPSSGRPGTPSPTPSLALRPRGMPRGQLFPGGSAGSSGKAQVLIGGQR